MESRNETAGSARWGLRAARGRAHALARERGPATDPVEEREELFQHIRHRQLQVLGKLFNADSPSFGGARNGRILVQMLPDAVPVQPARRMRHTPSEPCPTHATFLWTLFHSRVRGKHLKS